jgi:hypothetical protein
VLFFVSKELAHRDARGTAAGEVRMQASGTLRTIIAQLSRITLMSDL